MISDGSSIHSARRPNRFKLILGLVLPLLILVNIVLWLNRVNRPTSTAAGNVRLHGHVARVPFQFLSGGPVVEATVNGHGPCRFLLDTGTTNVHLSGRLVKELDLPFSEATTEVRYATEKAHEQSIVVVDSLLLGEAEFLSFQAIVDPLLDTGGRETDGIIGYQFFRELLLTVDFPKEELILQKGALPEPNGQDILSLLPGKGTPTIEVEVNEVEWQLVIDSGFTGCVLLPETVAETLSFPTAPAHRHTDIPGELVCNQSARLPGNLRFGRYEVADPIIVWMAGTEDIGVIGMDILTRISQIQVAHLRLI